VSDFLKTKREEIAARLRELEPLVDEYRQLEAASAALAGLPGAAAAATRTARTPRRARAAAAKAPARAARPSRPRRSTGSGRRGRPRGSGTRALQTLELVKSKPGITIPEIASAMGIKQNYLYRVLPGLEKDGKVVKRDRGWHAS
jgi:sugar-specific transcriptional regulator TrmB